MAGLGMNLGAGLSQGYSQSANSGGSVNASQQNNYSTNYSWNDSVSDSWSNANSWTDADTARMWSAYMADVAWQRDMEAFKMQMDFNREEAAKQRAWQAEMANSIYTRSVKNMKEAGINPILAYSMGLSGANVGSGATASLGGSPQAPLAQNFMDSWSSSSAASHSESHGGSFGEGFGEGWADGSSWNSGWSNSEEGIVTALQGLSGMSEAALGAINAGNTLQGINNYLGGGKATEWGNNIGQSIRETVINGVKNIVQGISGKSGTQTKDQTKNGEGGGNSFRKRLKM